ncbi:hypothetical protein WAI453_004787 [Rhynchosporium graminicola]
MGERAERLIYLGTLNGANGSIHITFAVFKCYKGKGGYELRIRVLRGGPCGNVFPHDILDTNGTLFAAGQLGKGKAASLMHLKSQWLLTNDDPSKKLNDALKSPATRDENIIAAIKSTPRKKNALSSLFEDSESASNSDSDDDDFYDGTPIKRSASHIRPKSCNPEARLLDLKDGVSSLEAIESAFLKQGYRIHGDDARTASRNAKWKDARSVVESKNWTASSIYAVGEKDDTCIVRRLMSGEKIEDIQCQKRKAKHENVSKERLMAEAAKEARRLMETKKFEVGQSKIRQSKSEQPTIRPLTFAEVKDEARRAISRDYTTYKAEN